MHSRVYVEITNICNMHCSFCHGHHRTLKQMSLPEFSHILDQLEGTTKYIYYHLMGEPLTHPDLAAFLKLAKERGFHSVITTNGTLLDRRGEELLGSGVHKISVSVHSFEQDDWDGHERYLRKVADFAHKASKAGIIVVLRFWNRDHDEGRNDRAEQILRELLPGDWIENTRGIRVREKLHLEWGDRFEWPDEGAPVQGEEVFCHGMRDQFGILCDGTVVPCCLDSEGVIALGNVFREELSDILNSPRANAMKKGFERRQASEELCRRCGYAQRFV